MRMISKKPWQIYSLIAFVSATMFVAMMLMSRTGWQMSEHYVPLAGTAKEIKAEASLFHLWFEEMVHGDKSIDSGVVWAHLDKAEWCVNAMLHGGEDAAVVIKPLDDPLLLEKIGLAHISIQHLREIGQQRIARGEFGNIGSALDQQFDAAFAQVLNLADEVEAALQVAIVKEISAFKRGVYALVFLMVAVSFVVVFIIYRYEQSRRQAEEQIHALAFYDALTKLPNRSLLYDRLEQAMVASKRSGIYGALMFLDLDKFKLLNDTHGHDAGDLLLAEVARRITRCVREVDTVARFGGDEFVVVVSELDMSKTESALQAGIIAKKICNALDEPYTLRIQHERKAATTIEHLCSSSIGVVLFINHGASADDILKWADMAMYEAKETGCNRYVFYEPTV